MHSLNREINAPVIVEVADQEVGLSGWLAIDSTINNRCCGGLRMVPGVSAVELRELARAMTLKYGFLGLPHGGAKAGIVCDEEVSRERRRHLLSTFGLKIRALLSNRVYSAGPDMGTSNEDIRHMLEASGVRVPKRALGGDRSGLYTSLTVIASAQVAAVCAGLDLSNSTAAIEGFGKVGSSVAQGLDRLGCKIVAISTSRGALHSPRGLDVPRLLELSEQFGSRVVDSYRDAERIEKEELLELDVDMLFPCARHFSINAENAPRVRAKLISPGANIPVTEEAEDLLFQQGTWCVPDFVSNSGGVLGGTMEFAGLNQTVVSNFVSHHFSDEVKRIYEKYLREGTSLRALAKTIALDRFARVKAVSENRSLRNKAFSVALDLYRNGIIPKVFVGTLAQGYFRRRIEGMP